MENIINKDHQKCDAWDISTIIWGFSIFGKYDCKELFQKLEPTCLNLLNEMNTQEFINVLRAYS